MNPDQSASAGRSISPAGGSLEGGVLSGEGFDLDNCIAELKSNNGYKDFFRGNEEGDQNKQVQCDIEFLFAIMTDLDRLAVAWFDCSTAEDQKSWQLAFDPIVKEIQRLGENTCLIPDEKVRGNFFAYIETFCSFMQERPSTDLKSMLQQEHEKRSQDSRGGVYNTNRLPWHDFLHHYAPGLPMVLGTRRSAHENGTRQVIPVGGIRLLYEWGSDFDNYIDEINPDEDKVVVNGISFHNAQVQGENALGGKKRRRELAGIPRGPEYCSSNHPLKSFPESLEDLSREYGTWTAGAAGRDRDVSVLQARPHPIPYMFIAEYRD